MNHARLALAASIAACLPLAACESGQRGSSAHSRDVDRIAAETPDSVSPLPADVRSDLDRHRATLGRMLGRWTFSGWSRDDSGNRYEPTGRAVGAVEHRYFLELTFDYVRNDPRGDDSRHSGSMIFGAEAGAGVNMIARFDTSGNASEFQGHSSGDGTVLGLRGDPSRNQDEDIEVVIKFLTDDEWTMEFIDRREPGRGSVGAFRFERAAG